MLVKKTDDTHSYNYNYTMPWNPNQKVTRCMLFQILCEHMHTHTCAHTHTRAHTHTFTFADEASKAEAAAGQELTLQDFRESSDSAYDAVDVPDSVIDLLVDLRNWLQVKGCCCRGGCRYGRGCEGIVYA